MHRPDGRALAALTRAETTYEQVRITERLDPDVWTSIAKTLNMLGGDYQPNRSTFTFAYDPRPALRQVIDTGVCRTPGNAEGYVPTPDDLAEELTTSPYSDLARMPEGSRVLEPSAGDGQIVRAILDANDEVHVTAVEPNPERAAKIGEHGDRLEMVATTFEEYAAGPGKGELFDAVVMNPPFSVPGRGALWIDHVLLAWNLLEPGGRLVAVVPDGFTFRDNREHRDMRQLVDDFGGWHKLPPDAFKRGLKTCVIWLARPVPGQEGRPPYLFRHYPDAIEPVRVRHPWLTTRAVREAPVQVWDDHAVNRDRVLRYRAQCWRCGWLLWEFDGDNDMTLGQHSACSSLDATEDDKSGLTVGLCLACSNVSDTWQAAMKVAHQVWDGPPSKAAPVQVWGLLLYRGGLIPVDGLERERYARVQAAMRLVFGIPEYASEAELIDARQAKPWRGGPDRLAAKYLQAYADRLDPDADLDDADRSALLWRTDRDAPAIALAEEPDPWGPVLEQLELDLTGA